MATIRLKQPGGLDRLEAGQDTPARAPAVGEIRVELHASSLNFHDYLVVAGKIPCADGRVPMSDGAGTVVAVGEDVTDFKAGERVFSTFFPDWLSGRPTAARIARVPGDTDDGYARAEVVAPATAFTRAPAGYSDMEAATLTCAGLTAWRALFVEDAMQPGKTVLVQGTGGVSIFALQFAKAVGAQVIATSSSGEKLERLRALGADHLINYREQPDWGEAAQRLTDGRGVDHVVEIGGAGTLPQSITACAVDATITMIGVLAGFAGPVSTAAVMGRNIRIAGLTVGSREHQQTMVRMIEDKGLKPVIDRRFALTDIAAAFRLQESGAHFGKICLSW